MRSFSRIGGLAILMIIVLRLSIGWQFLYEGLWKVKSYQTAKPWSAVGYLKNSQGPFREKFREMTGDPDEMDWLNYDKVSSKWENWQTQFEKHYKLGDRQKSTLDKLLNGSKSFVANLEVLPEKVSQSKDFQKLSKIIKYDPGKKRLVVDGVRHLVPKDKARLYKIIGYDEAKYNEDIKSGKKTPADFEKDFSDEERKFIKAVGDVFKRSSRLSFKEKLAATLKADPEYVGKTFRDKKKEIVEEQKGQVEVYQELLNRYKENSEKAEQEFQADHLSKQWTEIQQIRAELVGPVKALDSGLKDKAIGLLTTKQLMMEPLAESSSPVDSVNMMTIGCLLLFGILLICGLFTRLAAIGGAGMLIMFYLAFPPWPGVPPAPGPEHSFIINKNMIEAIALVMIATLPTGQWFGLDRVLYCFFKKPKK